ncbi:hypothetical protein PAHAL_9G348000 [Panicum hallii]|uniref:DUF4283 domain-containing protein n=1 Tax=Panicum hallii TaxID=206008 RepID=A0A2T8I3G9_9POAL|nr:hypothetical protein PAHAL_9G348000 [Panicum hallii]
MESMEGMMKHMQLTAAEKRGIMIGARGTARARKPLPLALGKVLAKQRLNAEGLAQVLRRICCPIKGISIKDLGEKCFLFTFLQPKGKYRALEDGPWMFGKGLVVMVDLDERKTLEEIEFAYILIWVRMVKMPFWHDD